MQLLGKQKADHVKVLVMVGGEPAGILESFGRGIGSAVGRHTADVFFGL
jgi:hypothetical protein